MTSGADLRYDRVGSGERMLLIHGIGHRRQMWRPLFDRLASDFDMVTIDLPGFGESPPVSPDDVPTIARLADLVEEALDGLGWPSAHLVGNSLGGWLSLELARRGRAQSVCALMPAGLWKPEAGADSLRTRAWFKVWTMGAHTPFADTLARSAAVRTIVTFGLFGKPWRIPPDIASGDARNMRACDFARTMKACRQTGGFSGGHDIAAPITVVFGGRDPIIRPRLSDLTKLPLATTVFNLRGLGHVPTWDDPDLVAATVRRTTSGGQNTPAG